MPMYSIDKENALLSLEDEKEKAEKAEKSSWNISASSAEGNNDSLKINAIILYKLSILTYLFIIFHLLMQISQIEIPATLTLRMLWDRYVLIIDDYYILYLLMLYNTY